jgi:alpha-galactosidase
MIKITIIGACSLVYGNRIINDLLHIKTKSEIEICLMSPHEDRLRVFHKMTETIINDNNLRFRVSYTNSLEQAIEDSSYVICIFNIGGFTALEADYLIPAEFGINQCIGDTMGPGGIFRAQRAIPKYIEILKAVKEFSPAALVINYVNPLAMLIIAGNTYPEIKQIGLCLGVEETKNTVASFMGRRTDSLDFSFAGINHMSWMLSVHDKISGEDMYPVFKKLMESPENHYSEKVRFEMMQTFGYFLTETSGHTSDMLPWFRNGESNLSLYCRVGGYGGNSGIYYRLSRFLNEKSRNVPLSDQLTYQLEDESGDYTIGIISAIENNTEYSCYGNFINKGSMIRNLPDDCCIELPAALKDGIIQPNWDGRLPDQLAAINQSNIIVQRLAVQAALSGNPDFLVSALSLDPLTSSILNLQQIKELADRMLDAESEYLPQYRDKKINKGIIITAERPPYVKRVPAKALNSVLGK